MDIAGGGDRDVHVAVCAYISRRCRLCKQRRIVDGDLPRRWLARGIGHDLEVARHKPILVDRVVVFSRQHVEADVVRLPVGEYGYEGRQVEEVRWEVDRAVGCDRSGMVR